MLTVIDDNSNRDLTTLAVVKAELGTTEVSDDQLSKYITQASDVIAQYCNRVFAVETVAETFRVQPQRSRELMLTRYPITEVVSVVEGGTTLTTDQYEINLQTGIADRISSHGCPIYWCAGQTVVTYSAGYEATDIPQAVQHAAILLVKQFVASGDRDPMVRSETSDGVGSTDYFSGGGAGLPPEVQGLISLHVRPNS
ncbi:hypothetical protein [Bradyrhizobium sp. MOS002]|uniref:hypothetical protein n=1 Tax=Bradyrhizobium sp. MOS002 TaxID=2133947 RepID=UPI000D12BE0E|nr:hypothetical protein [Bradyrhizobium sp. MOS002]PSO30212.1 hypothetical protein C7G41_19420 [Bradyrhizobium sp. MOS002]